MGQAMNETVKGQKLTPAQLEKAEKLADEFRKNANHVQEADVCAQEILELLPKMWAERGFSPEQSVFAIALVTIHLREKFPVGKERFDAVAHQAHKYYAEKT
jgi:hypothetical protein